MKYLAIKNWRKFQIIEDGKPAEYVKDYCAKDADLDRMRLSVYVSGVLDRLHRLRGLTGRILHNDVAWLTHATHIPRRDAPHMAHAIHTLTERKFIIPTDDENFEASSAHRREEDSKEETLRERERRSSAPQGAASSQHKKDKIPDPSDRREKQPQKPCACPDGLCDWAEPIPGCDHPSSVGDAVYYQRHLKRNEYFIGKLTRGYLIKQWKRILADTPEDFEYDADPMFKARMIHLDGGETMVIKEVIRRPKSVKERALLLKEPDRNREWLYDPTCKCRHGWIEVQDYPGEQGFEKLTHSELCTCVVREESLGATV